MSDTSFKLDPTTKSQWLEALRSGQYIQGQKWLRSKNDKFCCLGVLADIKSHSWELSITDESYIWEGGSVSFLNTTTIPWSVQLILSDMNDNGASFEAIAEWIEINL